VKEQKTASELKIAFYKIFKNTDPFGRMFNDSIIQKILLCPTNGYYLSKEQFYAVMNTSKSLGERSFYLYELEDWILENKDKKSNYSFGHGELSNEISYEKYKNLKIVLENALYSTSGNWGVIISHEDHAVMGGTDYFIELFKEAYPQWEQELNNFIKMWKDNKKQYNSDLS